jgi:hypothetical protein
MVFAQPTAKFGGYIVSSHGFQPNADLTKAIREIPQPKNITDVKAFHGLCQQVGNFSTKVAESLKPLSPLLKKDLTWEWTTTWDVGLTTWHFTTRNGQQLCMSTHHAFLAYDLF